MYKEWKTPFWSHLSETTQACHVKSTGNTATNEKSCFRKHSSSQRNVKNGVWQLSLRITELIQREAAQSQRVQWAMEWRKSSVTGDRTELMNYFYCAWVLKSDWELCESFIRILAGRRLIISVWKFTTEVVREKKSKRYHQYHRNTNIDHWFRQCQSLSERL